VWGLALFGLVACAGFGVRAGASATRLMAAPALAVQATPPVQKPPQGVPCGQAAVPGPHAGAATATPAQTPPSGRGPWDWWCDDAVKKEIGLRPNQAADIDRIYQRRLREMDPVVQAYVQERALLTKMIADRVVDDTQFDLELTTRFYPLRLKLDSSRDLMLYRISKVLDADQFSKLQAIIDRRDAGRRGREAAPPRPPGLPR
jgi:hypothetical protein